ncbi:unnamed protein product, partial [Didymodactylos carnosus]
MKNGRPAELEKQLKPTLVTKLKSLNILVPSSFNKKQLIELLLLNEIEEKDTSPRAESPPKPSQTTVAASASFSRQQTKLDDYSFCLQSAPYSQNDNDKNTDRNTNENHHSLNKFSLINRILTQNDQIIAQNASILSVLTTSTILSTEEKKQTKSLDPSAPIFDFHDPNSFLCCDNHSPTRRSPSHSQNLSSTPNKTSSSSNNNSCLTKSSPKLNSNVKTTIILGDSLLKDLDPKILSDKTHNIKIRTHSGENLNDLNEKLKSKYEYLLQTSNTAIFVCGTNSINKQSVSKCIEEAESIIKTTKLINSKIKICMVAIPFRARKLNEGSFDKIADYNKQLKILCQQQNVEF